MAKRFTDSNKFNDTWYRKLPLLQKVIWEFLLAECNHAGILENFDLELMSFKIGSEVTKDDLKLFSERLVFINEKTLFLPKFLEFQYGVFNEKNRVHANVLKELNRYNISAPWTDRGRTGDGPKEKEKEKEKEYLNKDLNNPLNKDLKEKEKINKKEKEKDTDLESLKFYGEFHNVGLTDKQYQRLLGITLSRKANDELIESLSSAIERGKEPAYDFDLPNAHFVRLRDFWNWRKKHNLLPESAQAQPMTREYIQSILSGEVKDNDTG